MKLSIILSSQNKNKYLKQFLESMHNQISKNFEILLTIDKPSNEDLKIVEEYQEKLNKKIKVFLNSSIQGKNYNWISMIEQSKGKYITILHPESIIKHNYVKEFTNYVLKYNTDVIEFRPEFKGIEKWAPKERIKSASIIEIQNNSDYIAYSFPLIFNKFWKKSLLKKVVNEYDLKNHKNIQHWIELNYLALINSKSYVYVNKILVEDWNNSLKNFSYNVNKSQWENIIKATKDLENKKYLQEIFYAQIYHYQIFLPTVIGIYSKNKLLNIFKTQDKDKYDSIVATLYKEIQKMRNEKFKLAIATNKFLLYQNNEVVFLNNYVPVHKWHNLHKKF